MAGALTKLLLLILVVAAIMIMRSVASERNRRKLMLNPPKRSYIEICLPYGVNDSNKRMQSFYARVRSQAEADSAMRKAGLGTIQAIFVAQRPPDGTAPIIRFFLVCDPDKIETVKRFLRRKFDQHLAQIMIHEEDPLALYIEKLKPEDPEMSDTEEDEEPITE